MEVLFNDLIWECFMTTCTVLKYIDKLIIKTYPVVMDEVILAWNLIINTYVGAYNNVLHAHGHVISKVNDTHITSGYKWSAHLRLVNDLFLPVAKDYIHEVL